MRKLTAFTVVVFLGFALGLPDAARAQLPAIGAHADASASSSGGATNSDSDDQPTTANASATGSGSDLAQGDAQATVGGVARSNSQTSGASGSGASAADATARWVQHLTTSGSDPGVPVDIDLSLNVDGVLHYLNNNSGAGPDDIRSSVRAVLRIHDASGVTTAFDGTAKLATITNPVPPALTRTGDWAPVSRDGDFSTAGCSAFNCNYDVNAVISFNDAVLLGFGDTFAVELEIRTDAFIFAGFETESGADFFNTASVAVSTSTAGVTIENVPAAVPMLEDGLRTLLVGAMGLLAMGAAVPISRRARRGQKSVEWRGSGS